ncbi:hypothetical protein UFOVP923_37 [uncultured Caudovirales phage]|uniref:Uncharacterized protein n=1 Tax=uncultured Caudovirales phage TaxID=2100421 RepID=A0A6J5PPK7_9CAUD|nr:hypothetical protein UFOVP923_37 [uncultured Caudovirales phage]
MVPATQNIKITRGDTEVFVFSLQNSNGTAMDLTGSTFASQIRYAYDSTLAAASFVCVLTNPTGGVVTATLAAGDSALLTAGAAYWDLQRTEGSVVTTILSGKCSILPDVTRL